MISTSRYDSAALASYRFPPREKHPASSILRISRCRNASATVEIFRKISPGCPSSVPAPAWSRTKRRMRHRIHNTPLSLRALPSGIPDPKISSTCGSAHPRNAHAPYVSSPWTGPLSCGIFLFCSCYIKIYINKFIHLHLCTCIYARIDV